MSLYWWVRTIGDLKLDPKLYLFVQYYLIFLSELIILQLWELEAAGSPWVPPRLENLIVLLTRSGYFIQQHHLASFGRFHIVFLAPGAGYTLF